MNELVYHPSTKNLMVKVFYSKSGINQYDTYRGHYGAITGLHFHPLSGPVDFSDLFLTSSVDWTVKLWRAKVSDVFNFVKTAI
jgi:dynein intermediate chain